MFHSHLRFRFACRGKRCVLREVVVNSRKHRNGQRSLCGATRPLLSQTSLCAVDTRNPFSPLVRRPMRLSNNPTLVASSTIGGTQAARVRQGSTDTQKRVMLWSSITRIPRMGSSSSLPTQSAIGVSPLASGDDHVSQCPCRLLVGLHIAVRSPARLFVMSCRGHTYWRLDNVRLGDEPHLCAIWGKN